MLSGLGTYAITASKDGKKGVQAIAAFGSNTRSASFTGNTTSRSTTSSRGIYERKTLEGFITYDDLNTIRDIARDMYEFDPITGTAIDILSTMPFSPFDLTGLSDQKVLNVYAENINAMDITSLSPEISKTYMVDGEYVGQIDSSEELNILTGIVPIDIGACVFVDLPFPNRDPIIDVSIPENLKTLMRSRDPRIADMFSKYGSSLKEMIKKGMYPLKPETTIYFPRRTLSSYNRGTSYLKRLIPVWLYEKALQKGTIDLAHRRQKSLLHIMVGDEDFLPSESQLGQYAKMFSDADADPLGAIIATRPNIQTNELRDGASFWRSDETNDFFTQQKLRGLGISEGLITGDLTVDSTTNAMTILLDNIRHFRENYTRKIFYQKVLLSIAIKNDFVRKDKETVTGNEIDENHIRNMYPVEAANLIIDTHKNSRLISGDDAVIYADDKTYKLSDYHLPKIEYHKPLKPEGNTELMTNLQTIQGQGLPIPLRTWAIASGISIPELLRMMPEDIKLRKSLQAYKSQWPVDPNAQAQQLLQSSFESVLANQNKSKPLLPKNRDFSKLEYRDPDTKKLLSKKGKAVIDEKANKIIVESAIRVNSEYNRRIKANKGFNSHGRS